MEYLKKKPVCLVEKRFLESSHDALSEIYQLNPVTDSAELWALSEKKKINLIVASGELLGEKPAGILKGITALHPSVVLLFLTEKENVAYLIDLVNSIHQVRITQDAHSEAGLRRAAADALSLFLESNRKDKLIEELRTENEQYEFMLRQSLLS